MEVCVYSETGWAISDVDYGYIGEDTGVSERLSHFCDFASDSGWDVILPETEDELADILSRLV